MANLTPKQKVFCEEYLIDLNATQAAIRAGYSEKTAKQIATENLSKPVLQEYISELQEERSERTEITADYVLNTIKETVENAKLAEDRSNALRGCELLGRHLKLFTDKIEHDVHMTHEQWLDQHLNEPSS